MSVDALQHAVSVCVLSKPICFEDPYGTPFSRPLPTPVCLVSFGADLIPHPSTHISNTAVARFGGTHTASSIESVAEHVQHCTGDECGIIQSPIAGAARDAAAKQRQTAVICPARVTNDEVQQHLMRAACAVVFVSPLLFVTQGQCKRRCVEGSLIAFFTNAGASSFLCETRSVHFHCSLLDTAFGG